MAFSMSANVMSLALRRTGATRPDVRVLLSVASTRYMAQFREAALTLQCVGAAVRQICVNGLFINVRKGHVLDVTQDQHLM